MKIKRHPQSPNLLPDPTSDWETYNLFNPAVIYHNGLFHMYYRAQGLDWVSRIGYAVRVDGIHWNRMRKPVLTPINGTDFRSVEDPRVLEIVANYFVYHDYLGIGWTILRLAWYSIALCWFAVNLFYWPFYLAQKNRSLLITLRNALLFLVMRPRYVLIVVLICGIFIAVSILTMLPLAIIMLSWLTLIGMIAVDEELGCQS